MNRKLLALAIAAALPLTAQAAPAIYGKIDTSLEVVDEFASHDAVGNLWWDNDLRDSIDVNSNTSYIGVKGGEKLTDSLNAIYKLEWGFSSESNDNVFDARDRFIGLQGDAWGTVRAGRFVSPFRAAEGSVDQFNESSTLDIRNFIAGQDRLNNTVGYTSPLLADAITVEVALQQGEGLDGDSLADGISASVAFDKGGLYLAAAINQDVGDADSGNNQYSSGDSLRLVAGYTVGDLQLGALVQTAEGVDGYWFESAFEEDSIVLSAAYKLNAKNTVKAQLVQSERDYADSWGSKVKTELTVLAVGLDHQLSANTKVYGHIALSEAETSADYGWSDDASGTLIGVGIAHKF